MNLFQENDLAACWMMLGSAPKNATHIELLLSDGSIVVGHWAQDLSGEEQPPFIGWYYSDYSSGTHHEIPERKIDAWRHLGVSFKNVGTKWKSEFVSIPMRD